MNQPLRSLLLVLLAGLAGSGAGGAPPVNSAPTPPMGWNSWNWHGKAAINEKIVEETIDALVTSGLRDAGYTYVVVDGGWRDTALGPNGELRAHPVKFPRGMKHLADYAHARGLKFGLHTVPGTRDCGGDPVGGYGHEEVQVRQLVDWGLDFVKLDKCRYDASWDEANLRAVYLKWSDLLAHCGRDIVFSISAYAFRDWYPGVCQMARTTHDIKCRIHQGAVFDDGKTGEELRAIDERQLRHIATPRDWDLPFPFLSVMTIAELNNKAAAFAGHGYWNDPDMLVTGDQGLAPEEQKAHFALWCVMTAPLMLGNDPRYLTPVEKEILLNPECIAIDQDPTEQGRRVTAEGDTEVWVKRLRDGRRAVLLLNRNATATIPITYDAGADLPAARWTVRDVFGRADIGIIDSVLSKPTPPRGCWFLLLSPRAG